MTARVKLEDYGNLIYASAPDSLGGGILGEARHTSGNAGLRWVTTVTSDYKLHATKADARRDLRERAQAALDAVERGR